MNEFDALIIGAGPAGASCALGLVKRGWRVVLIDKSIFPRPKTCGGFIGPENEELLTDFGIWPKLLEQGACIIEESMLSSSKGASSIIPIDGKALGVSRKVFDSLMLNLVKSKDVEVFEGCKARNIYKGLGGFEITLDHHSQNCEFNLKCRHLIDASGQHSPSVTFSKLQYGLSAMYQGIPQSFKRVMLHCCEGGHVGINPFENGLVNVCYVVDSRYFKDQGQNPEKVLMSWIRQSAPLHHAMIGAMRVSPWKAIQIPVRHSIVHYENGIWRVGNSSAFIDTVMGAGISIALQGGKLLAKVITGYSQDAERIKAYTYEYKKNFIAQRRLAGLFGQVAHHPWAVDTIIRFLDINKKFRKTAMRYSRPRLMSNNKIGYVRGVLNEV